MNIKTIIAAVVALTASPLALASGHTMEFYVGGDMGQVSLNDHSDDCDAQRNKYVAATGTKSVSVSVVPSANTTVGVTLIFPAATASNAANKGSCEDGALAPRMVVGYKVNDMFSVEGFFGWASGFDSVVTAGPRNITNTNTNFTFTQNTFITGSGTSEKNYLAFEDKTEVDYTYFGLVLNGQYEVSRGIMVGGKIGIQQASADATRTVSWNERTLPSGSADSINAVRAAIEGGVPGLEKENKTEAIYGIGAAYQITDELSVRGGYDLSGVSNYIHGGVTYSLSF